MYHLCININIRPSDIACTDRCMSYIPLSDKRLGRKLKDIGKDNERLVVLAMLKSNSLSYISVG